MPADNTSFGDLNQGLQVAQNTGGIHDNVFNLLPASSAPPVTHTPLDFQLPPFVPDVPPVDNFVGRDDDLRRLEAILESGSASRRLAVLQGLGGLGKTQLALAYIRRSRDKYSAVLWLNAKDENALKQSFNRAARRIVNARPSFAYLSEALETKDLTRITEGVLKWLDERLNENWLLIYDNYDNPLLAPSQECDDDPTAFDIREFFPATERGAIIVTTRSVHVKLGRRLSLAKLGNISDAVEIVISNSEREELRHDPSLSLLAQRLDGLPLALASAGSYMDQPSTTCAEYLERYDASWVRLHQNTPSLSSYEKSLYSTWDVSFQLMRRQSLSAANIIRLWAYFDNSDLWFELLKDGSETKPAWLTECTKDKIEFDRVMRIVCSHGLAQCNRSAPPIESPGYSIHACVQEWSLNVLNDGQDTAMIDCALNCIAAHGPGRETDRFWLLENRLIAHADRCVGFMSSEGNGYLFHSFGYLYHQQGRLADAEAMYERALDIEEKAWGPNHVSTWDTLNNLGSLLTDQDRLEEAETVLRRAVDSMAKAWGAGHWSMLFPLNNLGTVYLSQGRLQDAEQILISTLDSMEKALEPNHTWTLQIVDSLGIIYRRQGRLQEAETMHRRALHGREKTLGPEHLITLSTVDNQGALFRDQGRLQEAEAIYKRALDGYRKSSVSIAHFQYARTLQNYGLLCMHLQRPEEALQSYSAAVQGYERRYGSDSAQVRELLDLIQDIHNCTDLGSIIEESSTSTGLGAHSQKRMPGR